MERTYLLSFLIFISASIISCGSAQQYNLQGGYKLTVEFAGDEYLRNLMGYMIDSTAEAAIEKSVSAHEVGKLDWVQNFSSSLPNETRLNKYFASKKREIHFSTDNENVIKWLHEKFDSALDQVFQVMRLRIDEFGVAQPMVYIDREAGQIGMEMPGLEDHNRFRKMILQGGNLGFWRTATYEEFYERMMAINEWSLTMEPVDSTQLLIGKDTTGLTMEQKIEKFRLENPFWGRFKVQIPLDPGRSIVGYAAIQDTAGINIILKSAKEKGMWGGFKLLWMAKPEVRETEEEVLGLICIRDTENGSPQLGGEHVNNAVADFDNYSHEPIVLINMNSEGAKKWARLTRDEIGNEIAMTLDDYVLTAPRVNDQITGGRTQITGNFTVDEARDLATMLKAGSLPAPLSIVSEEVIKPQTQK